MIRIEKEKLYYTPFEGEEIEIGKIADGEIQDGYFSLNGYGFPVERFHEIQVAWDVIYPNGKPKPEPIPEEPQPNNDIEILELDYRLTKIELGVK